MDNIEKLNNEYISAINNKYSTDKCLDHVLSLMSSTASDYDRIRDTVKTCEGIKAILQLPLLCDFIKLGYAYLNCSDSIRKLRSKLLEVSADKSNISTVIASELKSTAEELEQQRDLIEKKYGYYVSSVKSMIDLSVQAIKQASDSILKKIEDVKARAIALYANEPSLDISTEPLKTDNEVPPQSIVVGRYANGIKANKLQQNIGRKNAYTYIDNDLKNQGNIIVSTDVESISDEKIDSFIASYILKMMNEFPLGSINIHIFDRNISYLFKRLSNSFSGANTSDAAKRIVRVYSDTSYLKTLNDVVCDDILRKTSVEIPDLYSIYESDDSDPFNLIIIRNCLLDNNGYVSLETLETLSALTKINDIGHRCGIRFLIVEDSASFTKNMNKSVSMLFDALKKNSGIRIDYKNGEFTLEGKRVELLLIGGNEDSFIQSRSKEFAEVITKKERNIITVESIASNTSVVGSILYIPIGKAGNTVVNLPLSCKDDNGTVEGQCIGFMAIGQSGSGKSSFFHSVVHNGCLKYSPRDLQFWLLDFKYGGASSKYRDSGLPHIRIVAEDNKIDDALCLFQMIFEEMERRYLAFNKQHVNDILDYNKIATNNSELEYFPRIIIAIDEVQEIFREDNASVLQKLISSIAVRMRAAGMHFIMVAQNLCDGKAYMLKDAFLMHVTGRICFRVAADVPRESGFDDDYIQRKQEISELKTGEAYMSFGKGTIKKVKVAYVSPQEMTTKYFPAVCERYSEYSNMKPLVIGSKQRLKINSALQGKQGTYQKVLQSMNNANGSFSAIVGEDAYRMSPLNLCFSQYENSSVLLLGNDKQIASSLCASIALSLIRQNVTVHLFNGDRSKIRTETDTVAHPFMYLCQNIQTDYVQSHRLDQLKDVIQTLYSEYLNRQNLVQKSDDEEPEFMPVFLIVNDLLGIESFTNNIMVESESQTKQTPNADGFNLDFDIFSNEVTSNVDGGSFRESIQTIMNVLLKNGYRYNMHLIIGVRGDASSWRNSHGVADTCNAIIFNSTEYADQMENSYYLKEMLRNISNDGSNETMAVWSHKRNYSKIRPIIYNMADSQEKGTFDSLMKGE